MFGKNFNYRVVIAAVLLALALTIGSSSLAGTQIARAGDCEVAAGGCH